MYGRIDVLAQLGRLATGKQTTVPVSGVAREAIALIRAYMAQTKDDAAEVRELERLFQK